MKSAALVTQKRLRVNPSDSHATYHGKSVEFFYELEGKLLLLTGELVIHLTRGVESVHIYYPGRLDPLDPPGREYLFRLSQAHLRSLTSRRISPWRIDFLLDKPVLPKDCVQLEPWERSVEGSFQ